MSDRAGWSGDEHHLQVRAAAEVGLPATQAEVESFTDGFKRGLVLEHPEDGALVVRGRTPLSDAELRALLEPLLAYLDLARSGDVGVAVADGRFELRVFARAVAARKAALDGLKLAAQLWLGFGLLAVAALQFMPKAIAIAIGSIGLVIGAWQLRGGVATGRAMLAARLTVGLSLLAARDKLLLPPADP